MSLLYIFDMDDVLYDYDWRVRMAGMSELTGLDFHRMRELWWHEQGEWAAEAGAWTTGEDYLAAFEAAIGMSVDEQEWVRIRGAAMTPRPGSLRAVERAAELGQVTLLTNNGALTAKHLHTLAPDLVPLFGREHMFTSSHYGARKPDPVVFERVLAAYGREPRHAFFADDMPQNVAGAASVGITAHLYRSPAALHAAVEDFAAAPPA